MTGLPPMLTVKECAVLADVSHMTIYRLVHDGTIPAHRVGRSIRIERADWLAYWKGTKQ